MFLDAGEGAIGDRGGGDGGGLAVFRGHHHAGGSGAARVENGLDRVALPHTRPASTLQHSAKSTLGNANLQFTKNE